MKEKDILYENGRHWVSKEKHGYNVWRSELTHSVRVGIVGFKDIEGLERAKKEADKRANKPKEN